MGYSGRSSFDTASSKLLRVDVVAEHDEAAHKQLPSNGYFRLRDVSSLLQSIEEPLEFRVFLNYHHPCLPQQEAQDFGAGLAD